MNIPQTWTLAQLGNLTAQIVGGGTPSKTSAANFNGHIPFMTVKDLKARFVSSTVDHISEDALQSSATTKVPADTLIVATRMSLGKIARPTMDVAINQDLKALFLHSGVNKTFVEYFWRSKSQAIQSMGTGTTVKGIRLEDIRTLEVPLAPEAEQKRIADKLDTVLTRVDAVNTRLARVAPLLKRFRQSVLAAATSGRLTEDWRLSHQITEREWALKSISDLAEIVDPHPSHRTPAEVADGVPYISIGDVDAEGKIDFENARKVSVDVLREHQERYHVKEGDFIFGKIGTIGRPTRLPVGMSYTISANVLLIQPNLNSVNPEFTRQLFSSPEFMRTVMDASTATSQAAFGIKKMRNTVVNVPTIEE